jgi:hypothetical protein
MMPLQICRIVPRASPPVPPPRPRPIRDYLYVDGHMPQYPAPLEVAQPYHDAKVTPSPGDYYSASKGSLVRIQYRFGNWTVLVPWPAVWILRGDDYLPARNRYGFAPSAEFGVPTFHGETVFRTDLNTVQPFAYQTLGAGLYRPEVDFVHGEAVTPIKLSQAVRAVKEGKSVGDVVKQYFGRK